MQRWYLVLAVLAGIAGSTDVAAQGPRGPYRSPAGPTLSPYLNYFRRDTGILDRHNALVAPTVQAQQTVQQLENRISEQRSQLTNLQSQLQEIRDPKAARTGTGSGFMNYSHYYRLSPRSRTTSR